MTRSNIITSAVLAISAAEAGALGIACNTGGAPRSVRAVRQLQGMQPHSAFHLNPDEYSRTRSATNAQGDPEMPSVRLTLRGGTVGDAKGGPLRRNPISKRSEIPYAKKVPSDESHFTREVSTLGDEGHEQLTNFLVQHQQLTDFLEQAGPNTFNQFVHENTSERRQDIFKPISPAPSSPDTVDPEH